MRGPADNAGTELPTPAAADVASPSSLNNS